MTVQSTDRKAGPFFTGTVLPFSFKVFSKQDIQIIWTSSAGVESTLVLDSEYSVTLNPDQDNTPGGSVTLNTAISGGANAVIIGDLAYDQGTDIRNQGGFEPEIIEDALDRVTILVQQLLEMAKRTLRIPASSSSSISTQLPVLVGNYLLGTTPDGTGFQLYPLSSTPQDAGSTVYTPAGIGAVVTTVELKLQESISVKDRGADLDGVSDDLAAFNLAGADAVALVPSGETFLSADASGKFYSLGFVTINGDGAADIYDLSTAIKKPNAQDRIPPKIIAHRGFKGCYPQNTIIAFSNSIAIGADAIEMDLQLSSDGVIYAFHDTTVDALTNGTGTFTVLSSATIDSLTLDELAGTSFASESIPRFEEVLRLARDSGIDIVPEIKGVWDTTAQNALLALLDSYGYNNEHCVIQAGFINYCEELRQKSSKVGVSYVGIGDFASARPFINRLKRLSGYKALTWNKDSLLAEPDIVDYTFARGVDLLAWVPTSTYEINTLQAIGVTKIIAETPAGRIFK